MIHLKAHPHWILVPTELQRNLSWNTINLQAPKYLENSQTLFHDSWIKNIQLWVWNQRSSYIRAPRWNLMFTFWCLCSDLFLAASWYQLIYYKFWGTLAFEWVVWSIECTNHFRINTLYLHLLKINRFSWS